MSRTQARFLAQARFFTQARYLVAGLALSLLGACNDSQFHSSNTRHWVPLTPELLTAMQEKGMHKEDSILIRTYKQEAEFEVWKKDVSGRYALLKTFPMCRWSGQLGPKRKEGDRQAPEGYYPISPAQMNPNSNYHLSYDMGYPNAYDRAHGGTGNYLMVHGDCSSAGCYSMTDQQIEEIYALVREAHSGGQKAVQMEAFPFRFTPANLARHRLDPNMPFWRELKEGADRFEITKQEPKVGVCNGHYVFDRAARAGEAAGCGADSDPELTKQVAAKQAEDNARVAELVSKGTPAVKLAYDDGGQNPSFRFKTLETSRPEAIAEGPNVELLDPKGGAHQGRGARARLRRGFDRGGRQGRGFAEHGVHLGRDLGADPGSSEARSGDGCFGDERRRRHQDRERIGLDGRYRDHGEREPSKRRFRRLGTRRDPLERRAYDACGVRLADDRGDLGRGSALLSAAFLEAALARLERRARSKRDQSSRRARSGGALAARAAGDAFARDEPARTGFPPSEPHAGGRPFLLDGALRRAAPFHKGLVQDLA